MKESEENKNTETYLTVTELSARIKMPPGSLRNLVWKKELIEGVHYVKPTPRKVLFVWSAIENWLWRKQVKKSHEMHRSKINI